MAGEEIDYAKMYQTMMKAAEKAIRILVQAQQECEQMYICAGEEGKVIKLEMHDDHKKG